MDLSLVRMLRGAINASSCKTACAAAAVARPAYRVNISPTPRIEPRPVYHPEPRFTPRPVIHPTPVVGTPIAPPAQPEPQSRLQSPIQAPWETLPWHNAPKPAQVVKIVVRSPDTNCTGNLIDMFI